MVDAKTEDWIEIAQRGFENWKAKPHNARWFRKIDGTPIPNDLTICIGEAFAEPLRSLSLRVEAEKRAREEATEDTRSLCRFILSEWGPDGALKATTYSLEQREARSAKGGDANAAPDRDTNSKSATSPGVTAGASTGWQPIETAPRDGTRFLTWDSYYGVRMGRAFMRADHDDWLSYVDSNGSSHKGGIRASHWMPLPAVPVDGGEDA